MSAASPDPLGSQHGGAVTLTGGTMLASAYRATLAGIARRRRDGLPSHDLQELARALRRAHMSAAGHKDAPAPPSEAPCNSQHGDLVGSAAAAEILGTSPRTARRLAANGSDAFRYGPIWLYRRSAVLALARERKARE
jgi:hypothetical protein